MTEQIVPQERTLLRRIKWFWQDSGEWIIVLIVAFMLVATGYTFCSYVNSEAIVKVVLSNQKERAETALAEERARRELAEDWNKERAYFRANVAQKNDDIRVLTETLAKMGIETTSAARNATETNKVLSGSKAAKEPKQ